MISDVPFVVIRLTSHLQLDTSWSIPNVESVLSWRRVSCEQQLDSQVVLNQFEEIRVFHMRLVGVVAHLRFCENALLRPGRMFLSFLLAML